MFYLRSPIQKHFMNNGKTCIINQLFGENKNQLFYGPEGHTGIDFRTVGNYRYARSRDGFIRENREGQEFIGRIPIVACHDGTLSAILNDDKQRSGWGVLLTSDVMQKDNKEIQYRTLYWHIETPWASVSKFIGEVKKLLRRTCVRRGAVIAIGGNNGKSTGPHLHLALDRREKKEGEWLAWVRLDPMPYFRDEEVLYQRHDFRDQHWFYKGEEITRQQADEIKKTLTPVKQ